MSPEKYPILLNRVAFRNTRAKGTIRFSPTERGKDQVAIHASRPRPSWAAAARTRLAQDFLFL